MPDVTWNPADKGANITLSGGDLIATCTQPWAVARATLSRTAGKWYFEVTIADSTYVGPGLATASATLTNNLGFDQYGCSYHLGVVIVTGAIFTTGGKTGPSFANGNVACIAVDITAGKLWFGINGTFIGSGDPAAGTNQSVNFTPGLAVFPAVGVQTAACTANFGESAFAYPVPTGYNPGWGTITASVDESIGVADIIMGPAWDTIDEDLTLAERLAEKYPMLLEESAAFADRSRGGFIYDRVTESIFSLNDLTALQFIVTLAETFNLADDPYLGLFEELVESLVLTDFSRAKDFIVVPDRMFLYDNVPVGWHKTVPESLVLTDVASKVLHLLISEWLALTDTQANMWHGTEVIPEALNLYDLAKDIQRFNKSIDESLVATDATNLRLCLTVLEHLRFADLAAAVREFVQVASDSLNLADVSTRGFQKIIADTFAAVDVTTVITTFFNSIAESLTVTDAASFTKALGLSIAESLVFTETVSNQGTFYNAVYETLHMNVTVEIDGEIWECYVLNTPKFHPSMYSGFSFNSYAVFEGRAYGANDTGIFELTGDTDAGATIHTGAILNETDFSSPNQKRIRRGYLGISGSAPVMVFQTENGEREVYSIDTEGKVVASSNLKGKNWKLSIADFSELSTVKLLPVVLTK